MNVRKYLCLGLIAFVFFGCASTTCIGNESTPEEDRVSLRIPEGIDVVGFDKNDYFFALRGELLFEEGQHAVTVRYNSIGLGGYTHTTSGPVPVVYQFEKGKRYILKTDFFFIKPSLRVRFFIEELPE